MRRVCGTVLHLSFVIANAFLLLFRAFFLSFRAPARNPLRGCCTPLSMTKESVDASLRYAPFSMTIAMSFRAPLRNPVRCGCFASLSMT